MTTATRIAMEARRLVLPAIVVVISGILVSACSDFKRVVGIERTPPDEFAVESRAPLTIPPDFNLRPPQPGASRPQEVSSTDRARKAIDTAGPGEPGHQATGALKNPVNEPQLNSEAQLADQSMAKKLLDTPDTGASVVVEKRETTTLKDVY
jgi:hypothetical protein